MLTLKTLISIACLYPLYAVYRFGWLPSISESYYRFKESLVYKKQAWLFIAFCFLIGFSSSYMGYMHLKSFWTIISGLGLCLVGVMYPFKDDRYIGRFHYIGAVVSIASLLIAVFTFEMYIELAISVALMIIALFVRNKLFWIEVIALGLMIKVYIFTF